MKKKNYSIYLRNAAVLAGCFGMLVSCNKEVALSTDTPVNDIPGAVRVLSLGIDALPDGEDAGSVPTTGKVGFFMAGDNGYTAFHNQPGEYTDGAWSPTDQLWLNNKEATLAVYYPYAASGGTTKAEIPMTASLRTDAGKDISAAKFTTNSQTSISKIILTQIYSRLVIKVIKDSEYTGGAGKWTNVTLEGNEVYTSGAYNPITETYTGTQAKFVPEEFSKTLGTSASADDVASVDMLLIPDVDMTGLTIDLTVDTRPLQATIASLPEGRFAPGKVQTVILTVSSLGLIINQVTITDWEDVPGEDYTVGAPIPPGITVLAGDINLGGTDCTDDDKAALSKLTWAPGNLRQAGDDGSGATIFAGATDYGHYYTWNSTFTGNNQSDKTDPCSTLDAATYGSGWRTPYKSELDKLVRCTDGQSTSNNGVSGVWFMNKTKGLFLPFAGFRNGTLGSGTYADNAEGDSGFYWSSGSDVHAESGDGYYLYNTGTSANVNRNYFNEPYGYSVRCVKGNPGLTVPASDINLGAECTANDKAALSKLAWARGNLKSSDNSQPYEWTTPTDYGYYYTWNSTYTGNTSSDGTDPCTLLDEAKYDSGWRTPSRLEFDMLERCSDKKLVSNNSVMGMWFMNNPKGLFLPAAGRRNYFLEGSGTEATLELGTHGYYWSSSYWASMEDKRSYCLYFYSGTSYAYVFNSASGYSVRCVKGGKQ